MMLIKILKSEILKTACVNRKFQKTRKLKLLDVNIDEEMSKTCTKHHLSHSIDKRSDEISLLR